MPAIFGLLPGLKGVLSQPGTPSYESAKRIVNEKGMTLCGAITQTGLLSALTPAERMEYRWVMRGMPQDVMQRAFKYVLGALNADLAVWVDWNEGAYGVDAEITADSAMHLKLNTPKLEWTELRTPLNIGGDLSAVIGPGAAGDPLGV